MAIDLAKNMSEILGSTVIDVLFGQGSLTVKFSNGAFVETSYWRLTGNDSSRVSIFDNNQKYGNSDPVDAIANAQNKLLKKEVLSAQLNKTTGDLIFTFEEKLLLECFNFSGNEVWHISFSNGEGEYSNFV